MSRNERAGPWVGSGVKRSKIILIGQKMVDDLNSAGTRWGTLGKHGNVNLHLGKFEI